MSTLRLKPLSYYLKLLAVTLILTVPGIIFLTAFLLATAVTIPLKFPICCETPARFGANYESMQFSTADGLTLTGWYVPPRNGAVIILVHSYYADRRQTLPVAEMLYKHGYGLLMYDQRASGGSGGSVRSLGWRDIPDLKEAAAWLIGQGGIQKIGAYGCSMGGAIALAGAVGAPTIQAVAADAPSPLGWDEIKPSFNPEDPFGSSILMLYYPMVMFRAWTLPTTSMAESIQLYAPRPVLFISTWEGEKQRIEQYYQLASEPKTHRNFPDSSHCATPAIHPTEYEQTLVEFFNTVLLNQP